MSSLRPLLAGLIDYAGLFPPASLGMREAVDTYASYLVSGRAWALGSFIVPVARLDELAAAREQASAANAAQHDSAQDWRLSVLASAGDAPAIADFNAGHAGTMTIHAAEIKAASATEIRDAARALRTRDLHLDLYFEVPLRLAHGDCSTLLLVVEECGARAKIRTGGVIPAMIPTIEDVTRFLEACRLHHVAFKATAGLHHAVRSVRPLTYEPGCAQATMHGFLNVFLASALVYAGGAADGDDPDWRADTRALLNETDEAAFRFDDDAAHWRTRIAFPASLLAETRARFATSFGSCSFTEPMEEMEALYELEAQEQPGIQEQLGIQEPRTR
jgi:hypothetical protein